MHVKTPLNSTINQATQAIQVVRCPNCGSLAERHHISDRELTRTQCDSCDYLLVTCARTGSVLEAYAPGLFGTP